MRSDGSQTRTERIATAIMLVIAIVLVIAVVLIFRANQRASEEYGRELEIHFMTQEAFWSAEFYLVTDCKENLQRPEGYCEEWAARVIEEHEETVMNCWRRDAYQTFFLFTCIILTQK